MAAVFYTGGRRGAGQKFTANPRLLLNAINQFSVRKLRSQTLSRIETEGDEDLSGMERGFNARNTLGSLKSLADFMGTVRGRREGTGVVL